MKARNFIIIILMMILSLSFVYGGFYGGVSPSSFFYDDIGSNSFDTTYYDYLDGDTDINNYTQYNFISDTLMSNGVDMRRSSFTYPVFNDVIGDLNNELILITGSYDTLSVYGYIGDTVVSYVNINLEQSTSGRPQSFTTYEHDDKIYIANNNTFFVYESGNNTFNLVCSNIITGINENVICHDDFCVLGRTVSNDGAIVTVDKDNCSILGTYNTTLDDSTTYSGNLVYINKDTNNINVPLPVSSERVIMFNIVKDTGVITVDTGWFDNGTMDLTTELLISPKTLYTYNIDKVLDNELMISSRYQVVIFNKAGTIIDNLDVTTDIGSPLFYDIFDDGYMDVCIFSNQGFQNIYCKTLNYALGTTINHFILETEVNPFDDSIFVIDVNNDGDVDMCMFPFCYDYSTEDILFNASDYLDSPNAMTFGDLNNDGFNDILVSNASQTIILKSSYLNEIPTSPSYLYSPDSPVCLDSEVSIIAYIDDDDVTSGLFGVDYKCVLTDDWLTIVGFDYLDFVGSETYGRAQAFNCDYNTTGTYTITYRVTDFFNFPSYSDTYTHNVIISSDQRYCEVWNNLTDSSEYIDSWVIEEEGEEVETFLNSIGVDSALKKIFLGFIIQILLTVMVLGVISGFISVMVAVIVAGMVNIFTFVIFVGIGLYPFAFVVLVLILGVVFGFLTWILSRS